MKYIFLISIIAVLFSGCAGKNSSMDFLDKNASYALGMQIGLNMKMDNIYPNVRAFTRGMKGALNNSSRYTIEEANQILNNTFDALRENRVARFKESEIKFLAENLYEPDIFVTDSGLRYEILTLGTGQKPELDDIVLVNYIGTLIDGTVFENTFDHGHPAGFFVYEVFAGLTEGLQLMNVGSIYRLIIPSELAFGGGGRGSDIPPYSPLIFEIELLSIENEMYSFDSCEDPAHFH